MGGHLIILKAITAAVLSLPAPMPGPWHVGLASTYGGAGDGLGNGVACGGTVAPDGSRIPGVLRSGEVGVAMLVVPCGRLVEIRYGQRAVLVRRIDSGPYVGGRVIDLTLPTAARLGFEGVGAVRWRELPGR